MKDTHNSLLAHCSKYPQLQVQDIFKFIYQSTYGCEHMVTNEEKVVEFISKEKSTLPECYSNLLDALDGDYTRVHLSFLKKGLKASTLGKIFIKSSFESHDSLQELKRKIQIAKNLVHEGLIPVSIEDFDTAEEKWANEGYPAIHHSEKFRDAYHPAYRVISNKFIPFLPLFIEIDKLTENSSEKRPIVIAIEGGSASGKSTLCSLLKEIYNCTVLHMDDFFLRPEQRTAERYLEVGGNVDWERFKEEVIPHLKNGTSVKYRRFNCSTMTLAEPEDIRLKDIVIVEGVYSTHPKFDEYYDLSVYLDISDTLQEKRILQRNTRDMAKMYFEKWIPLENIYFSKEKVKEKCDICIPIL